MNNINKYVKYLNVQMKTDYFNYYNVMRLEKHSKENNSTETVLLENIMYSPKYTLFLIIYNNNKY